MGNSGSGEGESEAGGRRRLVVNPLVSGGEAILLMESRGEGRARVARKVTENPVAARMSLSVEGSDAALQVALSSSMRRRATGEVVHFSPMRPRTSWHAMEMAARHQRQRSSVSAHCHEDRVHVPAARAVKGVGDRRVSVIRMKTAAPPSVRPSRFANSWLEWAAMRFRRPSRLLVS